jgi:hypothetical protein
MAELAGSGAAFSGDTSADPVNEHATGTARLAKHFTFNNVVGHGA